jgi:hypothetical protein
MLLGQYTGAWAILDQAPRPDRACHCRSEGMTFELCSFGCTIAQVDDSHGFGYAMRMRGAASGGC